MDTSLIVVLLLVGGITSLLLAGVALGYIDLSGLFGHQDQKKESSFVTTNIDSGVLGKPYNFSFCRPNPASAGGLCGGVDGMPTYPNWGTFPYIFSVEFGSLLPDGLSLEPNGLLKGTPTRASIYTFGICAKDMTNRMNCTKHSMMVLPKSREDKQKEEALGGNHIEYWSGMFDGKSIPSNIEQCQGGFNNEYFFTLEINLNKSTSLVQVILTDPPTLDTLELGTETYRVNGTLNGVQRIGTYETVLHHSWQELPPVPVGTEDSDWICKPGSSSIKDAKLKMYSMSLPSVGLNPLVQQHSGQTIFRNTSLAEFVFYIDKGFVFPNRYEIDFYGTELTEPDYESGKLISTDNYSSSREVFILEVMHISKDAKMLTGKWRDSMIIENTKGAGWFTMTRGTEAPAYIEIANVSCNFFDPVVIEYEDGSKVDGAKLQMIATGTAAGPVGYFIGLPAMWYEDDEVDCGSWSRTGSGTGGFPCERKAGDNMTTTWTVRSKIHQTVAHYPLRYREAMIGTGMYIADFDWERANC